MSKGLKALEKIDHTICLNEHNIKWDVDKYDHCACISIEDFVNYYNVIEEELKEYQHHEEILKDYGLTLANFREACLLLAMLKHEKRNIHDIDKQLQVLEVIKRISYYNIHFLDYLLNEGKISREEYDSLKEVLLQK